jgi:hypothetical protein
MSNNTITSIDLAELEADIVRITSRSVILEAAKILAALQISTDQSKGYEIWGADEVLVCADTGRTATDEERAMWNRYQVCKRCGVDPDSLTLEMVLRDMLTRDEEGDEEPDRVTYDEVMRMVIQ